MHRIRVRLESRSAIYAAAIALATAAQIVRFWFVVPPSVGLIWYAPFVLAAAILGGFGPGLLTTILCVLEAQYFVIEPIGSFAVNEARDIERLASLLLTGVIAAVFSEKVKRSSNRLAAANRRTAETLESISDGFNTFDREWNYTYVNAAAARMVGKAPRSCSARIFGSSGRWRRNRLSAPPISGPSRSRFRFRSRRFMGRL